MATKGKTRGPAESKSVTRGKDNAKSFQTKNKQTEKQAGTKKK